jgi:AcrR family transcriptional regulator
VAERAGVSKGGLMYRFNSKTALLQAMVGRMIDRVEARREQMRQRLAAENPSELVIEIAMLSELEGNSAPPTAAMLAAVANDPSLMEPFREEMRSRFARRIMAGEHCRRSTLLFLAAMGLHFSGLIDLPILDGRERAQAFEDLLRLARDPSARI